MKNYDESATVLWHDRKRWCGLPWTFTRYSVITRAGQNAKLINVNGLLTTSTEEIDLYRVDDISIYRSLIDKIFGVGTLTIYCNDASCEKLILKNVKNPFKVRKLIGDLVTKERTRIGVSHREMQF